MKLKVKVEDKFFEVEVGALNTNPIIATIEGEAFEVWLNGENVSPAPQTVSASPQIKISAPVSAPTALAPTSINAVSAPIPGVIISISVQANQNIKRGDELCVLEAMKMKSAIRAPRDGSIGAIRIAVGDHVKQKDVLMEYQ